MTLHTAMPMPFAHERYLGRPSCPRCGRLCAVTEISKYEGNGQISHIWQCDGCDREFQTAVNVRLS
jgi:hypothetical protein